MVKEHVVEWLRKNIIIVSKIFEDMKFIDRVELVRKMLPPDLGFDLIPLTPYELDRSKIKLKVN